MSDRLVKLVLASRKRGSILARIKITKRNKSIIIGLFFGLCCALCVGLYLANVEEKANAAQAEILARYGGDQIEVCVARRDIGAGETLAESDLDTKTWVATLLPADAITSKKDAVGKLVGSAILEGEVISSKRFGYETADIDVPAGFVALSVPAKEVQSVGGTLHSGMYCDIYVVGASATSRIGSSVLVLATSMEDGITSSGNNWITIALPPTNVEEMVSAAQNLELYFTLPSTDEIIEMEEI